MDNLRELKPKAPKPAHKPFNAYEPGYLHIDMKYLPQMSDEERRRYLFVAIDRAIRWVFVRIYPAKTAANARRFLRDLERAAPMKITRVLTDNDNTDQLVGLAFDLFLGTDPCSGFGLLAETCNSLLAGLDPDAIGLTVNSVGTLSADYSLTKSIVPVPLPAALPLMAGGIGFLGLMGWRRRRDIAA